MGKAAACKSLAKVPQSRARKEPQSRAEARQSPTHTPKAGKDVQGPGEALNPYSKGWGACVEFLSKDCTDMCNTAQPSDQLIHMYVCSPMRLGVQAEVDWYTGGSSLVEIPAAGLALMPGVYLAKTKWFRMGPNGFRKDLGPDTPVASINHLRWLGTRSELLETTKASKEILGKTKYDSLVQMLTSERYDPPDDME